jgi:hypothetical protein
MAYGRACRRPTHERLPSGRIGRGYGALRPAGGVNPPGSDPALDRLLPAGYRDSVDDAAEFRRFTEEDLAAAKVRNARSVLDTLGAFTHGTEAAPLGTAEVHAWLRTLTDLRLTLAARLDVKRDGSLPKDADEMTVAVYEWLGYLQESLIDAFDR